MYKLGLIGNPVSHSLSPKLFKYWFDKYNINATYEAFCVEKDQLADTIHRLRKEGYKGLNITMPFKRDVLNVEQAIFSSLVEEKGANQLHFTKNGFVLENYDWYAFILSLAGIENYDNLPSALVNATNKINFYKKKIIVIGDSNLTKSIIIWPTLLTIIYSRDITNKPKMGFKRWVDSIEELQESLKDCDLLINTTPLGMQSFDDLKLDLSHLKQDAIVFDCIYNPLETTLIKNAKARNLKAINGLGMFVHQAALSFENWFGFLPDIEDAKNFLNE